MGNMILNSKESRSMFVGVHKRDFTTLSEVIGIVGKMAPEVVFIVVTNQSNRKRFRTSEM